jgi:hypothetical protein
MKWLKALEELSRLYCPNRWSVKLAFFAPSEMQDVKETHFEKQVSALFRETFGIRILRRDACRNRWGERFELD